jgi:hypothetical protein
VEDLAEQEKKMVDLAAKALTLIERILQRVETTHQNKEQWQELGQYLTVRAVDRLLCLEAPLWLLQAP